MPVKAVLFDMDGTLIDSSEANIRYFQDLIESFGYQRPEKEQIEALLHLTSLDLIKNLLPNEPEERVKEIWRRGSEIYPRYIKYIKLKPGARKVIETLSRKYKLGVVTSRRRKSTNLILEKYELKRFFKVVITFEDYTNPKPNPEPILKALEKLRVGASKAVYIGDTLADFEAAKKAGVKSIICSQKDLPIESRVNSLMEIIAIIDSM